jgi:short-subunit dehydrogenase
VNQEGKTILVLGATSTLARAVAAEFASRGYHLVLVARDPLELERCASDLHLRYGIDVKTVVLDILDFDLHSKALGECLSEETLEGAILSIGYLGNQIAAEQDFGEARRILDTNFTASISLLNLLVPHFEKKRSGFICVLSSVAGDRGRRSNYIYGAAKGGLTLYLQGLRNRLYPSQVDVITVKLGVVDTQMTYGLPGLILKTSPQRVAKDIYRAILKRKDVFYSPAFWRWIMWGIRNIPETFCKRQKW